jgi:hypothetical protein
MTRQEDDWKLYKEGKNQQKKHKKQEEKSLADNRFAVSSIFHPYSKRRQPTKPLVDATSSQNVSAEAPQRNALQKSKNAEAKSRTQSHDVTSTSHPSEPPLRLMGDQHPSTRF